MSSEPIILNTFADLIEHGFKLHGTCAGCGVNRDIDLARCPAARRYVGARFTCRACGTAVMISLSKIVTSNEESSPKLEQWRMR